MYTIKKINNESFDIWSNVNSVNVDNFPWDDTGYKPKTEVKMYYTDDYIKIRFVSQEEVVRVECTEFNEPVYTDSCVEFFFKPDPENSKKYINFEMNAAGVLLLQLDDKTNDRQFITDVDLSIFEIKAEVTKFNYEQYSNLKSWYVEYKIPFSFIKKYFPNFEAKSGYLMQGNFYKCGDKTTYPHYGCWSNIKNEYPAFHKPEFFSAIMFG